MLSLRSYYLNNIFLLILSLLKGLLDIFDIKKSEDFLNGLNIPRNVLYVLNLLSCRLIKTFFTP
jgi:hypothetical protein